MNKEEFIEAVKELGIELTEDQLNKLNRFYELLKNWNEKMNLTRIIEEEDVYLKHFYDSLTIARVVNLKEKETLCDVGTGAGFPGLVIKIVYPNLKVTLVDSLLKRVKYLNDVIKQLNLKNVEAIHVRGEDFRGSFDVVTSRAVANIEKLLDYTMHLVNKNGVFVAMKGNIDKEITPEIKRKIEKKYIIEKIEYFLLPKERSQRSIIVIKRK